MPVMDGFEFLVERRKRPEIAAIPVVVITSAHLSEDDRQRLNGGVARIIHKEAYGRDELFSELRDLVLRYASPRGGEVNDGRNA